MGGPVLSVCHLCAAGRQMDSEPSSLRCSTSLFVHATYERSHWQADNLEYLHFVGETGLKSLCVSQGVCQRNCTFIGCCCR